MANAKKIQNEWNDKAESLGCKARIGGTRKSVHFYEWTGDITQGYEVWRPIDMHTFARLTNQFPELH